MKEILLTAGRSEPVNYIRALENAGARATLAKAGMDFSAFDGLVLCGGGDVNPVLYEQRNRGSYGISEERDNLDLACIHAFVLANKPVLGICRGIQVINIAFGGTLIQHLDTAENHIAPGYDVEHELKATDRIEKIFGRCFMANSSHHQGVGRVGRGLTPVAFSNDGVIEGLVHDYLPFLGVQFHPERMKDGAPVFEDFLSEC